MINPVQLKSKRTLASSKPLPFSFLYKQATEGRTSSPRLYEETRLSRDFGADINRFRDFDLPRLPRLFGEGQGSSSLTNSGVKLRAELEASLEKDIPRGISLRYDDCVGAEDSD